MTIFEVGDIARVPFPHVERARMTVRPAVVIAIRETPVGALIWVLMITNALRASWPGDVPIPDAAEKGLLVPCKVRTSKAVTVEAARAQRLGLLDRATLDAVKEQVRSRLPRY